MTRESAVAVLRAELAQHEADTATLGYPRRLMLANQDAVRAIVRSQGVEEAERLRAEQTDLREGGSRDMSTAEPLPVVPAAVPLRCGKYGPDADGFRWYGEERVPDFHECDKPAGHDGACQCACGQEWGGAEE